MKELLPCPFCKGKADTFVSQTNGYHVICDGCGAQSGGQDTKEKSIEAWNTRTLATQQSAPGDGGVLRAAIEAVPKGYFNRSETVSQEGHRSAVANLVIEALAATPAADPLGLRSTFSALARSKDFTVESLIADFEQTPAATPQQSAANGAGDAQNFRGESLYEARRLLVNVLKAQKSWLTDYAEAFIDDFVRQTARSTQPAGAERASND
jgi:Lar family restriction alleviation protein